MSFTLSSYDFELPESSIAQKPADKREESRLLHLDMATGEISDGSFPSLVDLLQPNDVLVVNDTRVFPARLFGTKETGGKIELMLLHYPESRDMGRGSEKEIGAGWESQVDIQGLLKSSKRPKPGAKLKFGPDLQGEVSEILSDATVSVRLFWNGDLDQVLSKYGNVPLPPYIRRDSRSGAEDRERYQTVYAKSKGAIAAPTAGLHFTNALLADIQKKGVAVVSITLHVGYGTFSPVRVDDIREHKIHAEYITVSKETAETVNRAKSAGGLLWAVGTTTTRALEYSADGQGGIRETQGPCDLYIYPGYTFQVVDNLITNFHLPRSSLLFMVSALAGKERVMNAYKEALKRGYRFYSYGDAMVITK